jgi:hypothetical protein
MCVHRTLPINTSRNRHAKRRAMGDSRTIEDQLRDLRRRADDDFLHPEALREPGRHQLDLPELGLRVSVTRSRYPNRPDGIDQYAVTLSRPNLDRRLGDDEVVTVLASAFGAASELAVERSAGASRVRMFRVPAQTGDSASS